MVKKRDYWFTVVLVAGETSGDVLGADLIRALKFFVPNSRFFGIAGPLMQAEGCKAWYKSEELAITDVVEIFRKLHRLLYIRTDLIRRCCEIRPDVFVGIDAPDFNLTLEENLKKRGIKTVHYVSPSVWVWRKRRVFKIKRSVDLVLTLFPFEKEFYKRFDVPCRFVGHATADIFSLDPDKDAARDTLRIPYSARSLVILPGSRRTEIEMLGAVFLKTAKILRQDYPDLEIVVPLVNAECRKQFEQIKFDIAPNLKIRLLDGKSHEAMIASDAALITSGTATLECLFAKCPMVVCYRMKPITFWLARHLVKTKHISLPNLLAGRELVKEFIQEKCRPKDLAMVLSRTISKKKENQEIIEVFREIHQTVKCNASIKAANAILDLTKS